MDKEWERLYEEAMSVLNPHDVSNKMWVGSVASAVLTKKWTYVNTLDKKKPKDYAACLKVHKPELYNKYSLEISRHCEAGLQSSWLSCSG